jgi:hypothetical protein
MSFSSARLSLVHLVAATSAVAAFCVACQQSDNPAAPHEDAVFVARVAQTQTFQFSTRDPRVIAEAEARIGRGGGRVLSGRLVSGNGAVNAPFRWHLDPDEVHFADAAIELCDGLPSHVEGNLEYWLTRVGRYCPWQVEVVSRVR